MTPPTRDDRRRVRRWAAALALAALTAAAAAVPYTPDRDDAVIESLPVRPDAAQRARQAALSRDPRQLPTALAVAQQAIAQSRRDGDPRELGRAQAALAPWWAEPAPPPPVRLLRATILQSRHDFDAARSDLDALLAAADTPAPLQAQALLTRASLRQLRGRFDLARQDCETLQRPTFATLGAAVQRLAEACLLELQSLTGDARKAQRRLDALAGQGAPDAWLSLLRAELAERLGDDAQAERQFRAAIASREAYALAAYADWLLDRRRWTDALAVLDLGPEQADALLLRRAIAWHRQGDPRAAAARATLRERFAAIRARGDQPHRREEARLALAIDGDAGMALRLAREQWAEQQEPADAVLLWRAAQAAGRPQEAAVLAAWVPDPRRTDVRLAGWVGTDGRQP